MALDACEGGGKDETFNELVARTQGLARMAFDAEATNAALTEEQAELDKYMADVTSEKLAIGDELKAAWASLVSQINDRLSDGSLGLPEALTYLNIPLNNIVKLSAGFEWQFAGVDTGDKLAVFSEQEGVVWGYVATKPRPHIIDDQPRYYYAGASFVLGHEQRLTTVNTILGAGIGEGILSSEEVWANVLSHAPFKGGGNTRSFDPHKLVLVGNALDAYQFLGGKPRPKKLEHEDTRFNTIRRGIVNLVDLKEGEDGSFRLSGFGFPNITSENAEEVARAIDVMARHFPEESSVLVDKLAICFALGKEKLGDTYDESHALDVAAVIGCGSSHYSLRDRYAAGLVMLDRGQKLLRGRDLKTNLLP